MINSKKKGFTIVELVIVIAVIAILAAVLIPTFSNLVKKANVSNDTALVKNLNTALAADVEDHNTMYDALQAAKEFGYDIAKINAKASDNEILWDSKNDCFVYYDSEKKDLVYIPETKTEKPADVDLWVISKEVDETYSTYLYGFSAEAVETTKGIDTSEAPTVKTINYKNTIEGQNVVICTNGGTLNVGETSTIAKGTIKHYGTLAAANIYTEDNSFHTSGMIAALNLQAGKVVVESGAYVGLATAKEGTKVEENGGMFYISGSDVAASVQEMLSDIDRSYKIGSKEELVAFRKAWNTGAINVNEITLSSNIDISGENWAPIGNWEFPFNGTFNGNKYKISGLTAIGKCEDGIYSVGNSTGYGETFGLFGIVGNGNVSIKDLTLEKVNINLNNGKNVGALIGYSPSSKNFSEKGKGLEWAKDKWSGNDVVGIGTITLTNIVVSGNVTAEQHSGGLVGKVYSSGKITITNCVNNANITSGDNCAGLVAYINGSEAIEITGSTNNGVVTNTKETSRLAYFAVVHTGPNKYGNITFTNNKNTANCKGGTKIADDYDFGFLTMSSYGSVKINNTNNFSGNTDSGSLSYGENESMYADNYQKGVK